MFFFIKTLYYIEVIAQSTGEPVAFGKGVILSAFRCKTPTGPEPILLQALNGARFRIVVPPGGGSFEGFYFILRFWSKTSLQETPRQDLFIVELPIMTPSEPQLLNGGPYFFWNQDFH